jgi:HD superfamily phosphohydrolase
MAEALNEHRDFIEALCARYLEGYLAALPSSPAQRPHRSPKEFNDPVWGTLVLSPFEVCFIDSPLQQRLRQIRQLGVVHLIYPSALHTRFEHAMGAAHLVGALIDAINQHAVVPVVTPDLRNTMRLAALSHDLGHGLMSHVSEIAVSRSHAGVRITREFADEVADNDGTSLSEINAYLMVGSGTFRSLIDRIRTIYPDHTLVDDPASVMQQAIIGLAVENSIPLLQELISGPFDADKLDYMKRDAYMSGVPVVTDIGRLVQKTRSVPLDLAHLPEELRRRVRMGPSHFHVTGMAFSGARTLDELMLGRILLFDKIYRHQKVRACEAMVASILRTTAAATGLPEAQLMMLLVDEQVLNLQPADVMELCPSPAELAEDDKDLLIAITTSEDLHLRKLWSRAYAFANNIPFDAYRWDTEHSEGIRRLQIEAASRSDQLIDRISDETMTVLSLLEKPLPSYIVVGRLRDYLHIDARQTPPQPDDSAYLITPNEKVVRFDNEYAETRDWVNAYHLTRDVGFIFSPAEIAIEVFMAVEKLVRLEFGIRTPRMAAEYAHLDAESIADSKALLAAAGYYDSLPYDIRPEPEIFQRGDIPSRVAAIVQRLEGYCGPVKVSEAKNKGTLWFADRVLAWLHQFSTEENLVEDALKVLENVKHINRQTVVNTLNGFITSAGQRFDRAVLAPFGEPRDSSAIWTYHAGDIARAHGLDIVQVDSLPAGRPLLFIDDFIGTGAQAISILESWFDVPSTTGLNEPRDPLPESLRLLLRESDNIAFVFAAGTTEGRDAFSRRLRELRIQADVYVHDVAVPKLADLATSPEFLAKAEDVGRALLSDGREPEWVEERVLGYGNDGYLVVFSHNTPTQTLTCLWEEGVYDGVPWVPLFPRRKK